MLLAIRQTVRKFSFYVQLVGLGFDDRLILEQQECHNGGSPLIMGGYLPFIVDGSSYRRKEVEKEGESQRIKEMLSRGQLSIPDPTTGFHHSLCARCPKCGHDSSVHRIERSGMPIIRVVFRCPICGEDFDAGVDSMFLR